METTVISAEVIDLLSRISRQKLREADVTGLIVFLAALISILRGVMIIDKTIALEEEERLQKTLKVFASSDRDRVELIQRIVTGISKQQVYFNPTELLTLTALFSDSEKLLLICFGYEMSAADGRIDLREQMYLTATGQRLGIDPRHIATIDALFTKEGTVDPEAFAEVKELLSPIEFQSREPVFAASAKHLLSLLEQQQLPT
ncbi:TerB family tellurite resistance protein [Microcoleus sp. EPA2]|uniref:TerB family tellurite resistance protein n=1 Tax=Microcoleus sp. EPA2 TaxID=2841654 RepID=UPI00312B8A50